MNYIYHPPKEISFDEIQQSIDLNNDRQAIEGIINLSLYHKDRHKVHEFINYVLNSCQNKIIKKMPA